MNSNWLRRCGSPKAGAASLYFPPEINTFIAAKQVVAVDLPVSNAQPQPRPDTPIFVTVKTDLSLALGCTLVTNNTREFERIEGLKLENWATPGIGA